MSLAEPENMVTREVRIFFIKKNNKVIPVLEVVNKKSIVSSTRLTLRQALDIEKTLAKFTIYVLRKKIMNYRAEDDEDLKTLKAMEKTVDALEIAEKNIEQLVTYMYRRETTMSIPLNHT